MLLFNISNLPDLEGETENYWRNLFLGHASGFTVHTETSDTHSSLESPDLD